MKWMIFIYEMAGVSKSKLGTGGMLTKLMAAEMVNNSAIDMIIGNSKTPYVLQKIQDGEVIGTIFKAKEI